jgi:uncharacterized pyridoxamine 5'-phosphate oxidase family protein
MDEVYDFLKQASTYYIATIEGDQPHVRPFGTIDIFDSKLTIQTGRSKDVSKQLAANPKAEICAFVDGAWLRVKATLVDTNSLAAEEQMLEAYPELKHIYTAGDGNNQIFYLTNATATFYSFTGEPRTVTF